MAFGAPAFGAPAVAARPLALAGASRGRGRSSGRGSGRGGGGRAGGRGGGGRGRGRGGGKGGHMRRPGKAKLPPHVLAAVEEKARLRRLDERAHFVAEVEAARTGVGGAPSHGRCLPDAEEDLFPHLFLGDDATDARSPDQDRNTAASVSSSSSATAATRAAELAEAYDDIPVEVTDPALEDPEIRRLLLGGHRHRGDFFSEEGDDDEYAAAASGGPPLDPVEPFQVGPPGIRALREAVLRDKKVALEKTKTFAEPSTNPHPREEEEEEAPGGSVPDAPSAAFDQLADTLSRRLAHAALTPAQRHAIPLALAGRDLVCSAATGSGKTLAYLVPAVVRALEAERAAREDEAAAPSGDAEEEGDPGPTFDPPPLVEEDDDAFAVFEDAGVVSAGGVSADDSAVLSAAFASVSAGAGYGRRRRARDPGEIRPGGRSSPPAERSPPAEPEAEGASDAEGESEPDDADASLGASLGASDAFRASVTPPPARPSVLILVPTRELATQVSLQARRVAFGTGLRVATLHGGQSVKPQLEQLARAPAVVVGTPGRTLTCAVDEPYLDLTRVATLVLDEADQMVDMGFAPQVEEILRDAGVPGPASAAAARGRRKISPPRKEEEEDDEAAGLGVVSLRSSPTTGRGHGVSTPSGGVASSFARRFDGRQTLLFSATFPRGVVRLATELEILSGGAAPPRPVARFRAPLGGARGVPPPPPARVRVGRVGSTTAAIEQRLVLAPSPLRERKFDLLLAALESEPDARTLVFCQGKSTAAWVRAALARVAEEETRRARARAGVTRAATSARRRSGEEEAAAAGSERAEEAAEHRSDDSALDAAFSAADGTNVFSAEELHGDMSQGARSRALDAFSSGAVRVLVATDVAGRGLDLPGVRHVVNFDLPTDARDFDAYVHRIGRTGRAGRRGVATSLYVPGFEPNRGNGAIWTALAELLAETGQAAPAWFRTLPEAGGTRERGAFASGGGGERGGRSARGGLRGGLRGRSRGAERPRGPPMGRR